MPLLIPPTSPQTFTLPATLDCGQAFRWRPLTPTLWEGAAAGHYLQIEQHPDQTILLTPSSDADLPFWQNYFDLNRDYPAIYEKLRRNPTLRKALSAAPGIRILRQPPWETLCTFIISANNNIPRIKGIVERLCQGWGDPLPGTGLSTFPGPERLAPLSVEELAPLRAGWRAAYILDAARQVAENRLDLEEIAALPTPEGLARLQQVKGVGVKVAQCTMLFGFGRLECVPMDVWMKRAMAEFYPGGFPGYIRPYGGIAQQVLFSYIRSRG